MELKHYEFNAHGVEIGQFYESSAVVSDGSARPAPARDPELYYQPSTVPGVAPAARLGRRAAPARCRPSTSRRTTGSRCSPASPARPGRPRRRRSRADLGVPLEAVVIGPGREVTDLYFDWGRLREVGEDGALLVRPDKHIGWRSMSLPADPQRALHAALSALLGRADGA